MQTDPLCPACWEWRSFDCQPRLWREALREAVPTASGSLTSAIHLLTRQSPGTVKLRDGRVEVKQLLPTNETGLELWQSVMNEGFPLAPGILAELCRVWQRPPPEANPTLPTAEHLLSFVSRSAPDVCIIPIREWRRTYRLQDCVAERVTVLVDWWLLETLSLAHTDLATLRAALRAVQLDRELNTNYVVELKRRIGW